ncbi:MAG: sensor histidine kinase [Sphingobacteriaceae bacterium]|jgi:signal transduction histidine kinase|nr:sensor histidine kinase [Sphingobacteriaceae bacterium]
MQIVKVALENEMDLALAYKKSIKAAELLGLSMSTQTAFATAVSEVCREVIDKTTDGIASIEIQTESSRLNLAAIISYKQSGGDEPLREGLQYAQKLVPDFSSCIKNGTGTIELKLNIPRSACVDKAKTLEVKNYFKTVAPSSAYEEVRQKNIQLFKHNEQTEIALLLAEQLSQQKNEFLSVASHELKTPLTILIAYAQLALKTDCAPATMALIKKVDQQAQKMKTLIQQLLDISKVGDGQADYNKEPVEFNSYLQEITEIMPLLVPEHHLTVTLGESVHVSIDKLRIEQVMMNIVSNAAKYSPFAPQIKISTKKSPENQIMVAVQDWGIGMSQEELNKIFKKFYRVEQVTKSFNGFGVGLYVSSKIITDHGGKIWVESEEGVGSTFCFTLPVLMH